MQALFDARRKGEVGDTVLLLEHEPVITLGRGAHAENLLASREQLESLGIAVEKTGRGGDVTLHAPGQLVAYPIIDLNPDRMDVRKYVQNLTEAMRRTVAAFGIDGGTISKMIGLWVDLEQTGAWPGEPAANAPAKMGAIGVRISRWVTQHGFALNLTTDLALFGLIVPCGISEYPVASVESLTGAHPSVSETAPKALEHLNDLLGAPRARYIDGSKQEFSALSARILRGSS
jgi:lipoyl(octanoyl) transferase